MQSLTTRVLLDLVPRWVLELMGEADPTHTPRTILVAGVPHAFDSSFWQKATIINLIKQYCCYEMCTVQTMDTRYGASVYGDVFDATTLPNIRWFLVILPACEGEWWRLQDPSSFQKEAFEALLAAAMRRVEPGGYLLASRFLVEEAKQTFFDVFPHASATTCDEFEYLVAQNVA